MTQYEKRERIAKIVEEIKEGKSDVELANKYELTVTRIGQIRLRELGIRRKKLIDWSLANWELSNNEIAILTNASRQSVQQRRWKNKKVA